jgi:hypothetical protein
MQMFFQVMDEQMKTLKVRLQELRGLIMKVKPIYLILLAFAQIIFTANVIAQETREIPADIKVTGNQRFKKIGVHNANKVRTMFYNQGELGEWKHPLSGEWPKGTGHTYLDGNALLVGASVKDIHGKRIHPIEAAYREDMRQAPDGSTDYGWQPLPGYQNPNQDNIAVSDQPETWPQRWPDKPDWIDTETGRAVWNGYFGRGLTNADQESYFVMDDDSDEEFDFYPDATDSTRRGLGLRVAVRGFQWVHVLAEDVVFLHYEITNVGTTDYDSVYFGMYFDTGIGGDGDSNDDQTEYDIQQDITYVWDGDGTSVNGGWTTGYVAYAFLESPGNATNNFDDDEDAFDSENGVYNAWLVDESRDSGPGTFDPSAGHYIKDVWHPELGSWSGDEDKDWDPYEDLNGDNKWNPGEPLNDDVGADGIGPLDENYPGPDEGEADKRPTLGEPDFDKTDKDESDQIGLTAVDVRPTHNIEIRNYERIWRDIWAPNYKIDHGTSFTDNTSIFYGSGPFPLKGRGPGESIGQTERFSMALVFGDNEPDILRNKATVQAVYNANYNFSKPPLKPNVTAVPGDGKVTLYWDDLAEKSYDRFLQRNDFQGYMIYRSTDYTFNEINIITDTYGSTKYYNPIEQFDKKDGIKGFHPSDVAGVQFNLGDDTGLTHVWTDTTVQNGRTYYYAVVSYDEGDTLLGGGKGLSPTPCASIIDKDVSGNFRFDVNTTAVTPQAPAAGYKPPRIENLEHLSGVGSGYINVQIIDPRLVKDKHIYQVAFESDTAATKSYSVYDVTEINIDTLIQENTSVGAGEEGDIFDGMRIFVFNDTIGITFESGDVFQFETKSALIDPDQAKVDMNNIAVVPNPYIATAAWEGWTLSSINFGRGERKVYFIHLPRKATIRIYTLSGNLVDTIEHDSDLDDGSEPWDLVSQDGMDIAYGVYIFHVDAPGIGEKIGKFAMIK